MNKSYSILVADDDPNDVYLLQQALTRDGFACTFNVVLDGEQAVEYLSGKGVYSNRAACPLPDVVLLDLKMPGADGIEVLRWMREQIEFRETPVIAMSSIDVPVIGQEMLKYGANGYILKRYDTNSLSATLKQLFSV